MAKNKDRWLRRQLEREEELRRRKLEYEDLKRNQEKGKNDILILSKLSIIIYRENNDRRIYNRIEEK